MEMLLGLLRSLVGIRMRSSYYSGREFAVFVGVRHEESEQCGAWAFNC
jgi:uncharacterized protein involved in copper resistance